MLVKSTVVFNYYYAYTYASRDFSGGKILFCVA